jgi:IS5 family transposase
LHLICRRCRYWASVGRRLVVMPQMGFFDLSDRYASLDAKKDPLVEINAVVPWEEFRPMLERVWRKPDGERKSRAGRKPMDAVLMFKTLVLSALYNLSDDQIEYQVHDRLSFMRFLGLGLGDRAPPSRGLQANPCRATDAKTVWLYREALAQAGKVEEVFSLFDGHLARQGYIARGGQILDASIVPVPRNHNKREENTAIKVGETPEGWADEPAKRSQKDVDARWTQKHGKSHYGYKNHVNVDRMHKLVRRYHVTDAAVPPLSSFASKRLPGNGQSDGGRLADAGQHRLRCLGRRRLPVSGDRDHAEGQRADQPHSPQGQAGQAADRAGEGEQPDQIQRAGQGRAYLRRAGE